MSKGKVKEKQVCTTIDAEHKKKITELNLEKKNIVKKKKNLEELNKEYNILNSKPSIELTDIELEKKLTLYEDIKNLSNVINDTEKHKNINKYTLNTTHILYDYYDHKEEKTILNFFDIKDNKFNNKKISNKNILKEKYLKKIDKNIIKVETTHFLDNFLCKKCSTEIMYIQSESIKLCPKCGTQDKILIDTDKNSYKETPREISYFAYKRINHFNEWLAQFQAKETTDIPKEVYTLIKKELKKESYIDMKNLKQSKIRNILKKIGLNKYYEHVPHIINRLSGKPAPIIDRVTEDRLRLMFKDIQPYWIKHCPDKRSNFLSYSYVLYKSLQLLEMDQYLIFFSLLKSREKLAEQDIIWKKICKDLKWEFIKTI